VHGSPRQGGTIARGRGWREADAETATRDDKAIRKEPTMGDWYDRDREGDQDREGARRRDRNDFGNREFAGRDRWRGRDDEQRSFDQRQPDPARGGYGYGYGGDLTAGQRGREARFDARSQAGALPDYGRPAYGRADYDRPGYGRQGYGRGADYDPSFQAYGRPAAGSQTFGRYGEDPQRRGEPAVGANPALQRVADGEADPAWRPGMGLGEHRGRGPKNYTRSDARIAEDVNDRLSDDSWLDASEIDVKVVSGEVTLAGAVHTREDKRHAEDLAERVSGVKHVQNNLRVEPRTPESARGGAPPVT